MCLSCKSKCNWRMPIPINRRTIWKWMKHPIVATKQIIEMGCEYFFAGTA